MVYIPEDFDLDNYEKQFTSQGSVDNYYPKVIIKNHLREKLIEDIERFVDEHSEAWKNHEDNIQEKHELADILIYEIINKRFGVE